MCNVELIKRVYWKTMYAEVIWYWGIILAGLPAEIFEEDWERMKGVWVEVSTEEG